jgi:hypothetical protein
MKSLDNLIETTNFNELQEKSSGKLHIKWNRKLYMVNASPKNVEIYTKYRGLIYDKLSRYLICPNIGFTQQIKPDNELCKSFVLKDDYIVYKYIDCAMIRIFYHDNSWHFATNNSLTNSIYNNLFISKLEKIDNMTKLRFFQLLDTNFSYTFLIEKHSTQIRFLHAFNEHKRLVTDSTELENITTQFIFNDIPICEEIEFEEGSEKEYYVIERKTLKTFIVSEKDDKNKSRDNFFSDEYLKVRNILENEIEDIFYDEVMPDIIYNSYRRKYIDNETDNEGKYKKYDMNLMLNMLHHFYITEQIKITPDLVAQFIRSLDAVTICTFLNIPIARYTIADY